MNFKRYSFVLLGFSLLLTFACASSQTKNEIPTSKPMKVEFETRASFGGVETIERETQWIDPAHERSASRIVRETKGLGVNEKEELLNITDKDWVYSINLTEKTGTKMNVNEFKEMAKAMGQFIEPDFKNLKEFVKKNGGRMLPDEEVLGKKCTVYEVMGFKQWLYNGVVLKVEMNGQVMRQAIRIEENITLPEDVFKVPAGIVIHEGDMYEVENNE